MYYDMLRMLTKFENFPKKHVQGWGAAPSQTHAFWGGFAIGFPVSNFSKHEANAAREHEAVTAPERQSAVQSYRHAGQVLR